MLSIRTQDRIALVPYNNKISCYMVGGNYEEGYLYQIGISGTKLGRYSKERALEVLDEIEETFKSQTKSFINNDETVIKTINFDVVYQMPKE
jgi:hypothetical protein